MAIGEEIRSYSEKILLGSFASYFKYHLVRWNIIKNSVPDGGLDIRDLRFFSEA